MISGLFAGKKTIKAKALFFAQRIDTKALKNVEKIATPPLVIKAGASGYAVLFRYGAVVLFNCKEGEENAFLEQIGEYAQDIIEAPDYEVVEISFNSDVKDGIDSDGIVLSDSNVERLQLVADVLGKSVTLSHYENSIAGVFDRIEPMAAELHKSGRGSRKAREFLSHMGQTLLIQTKIIGRVEVDEKPDILWDAPGLERLFARLEDEYELRERHSALKQKLQLIYETAEAMMTLLTNKRTLHVEWYITILIVIEIIMGLFDKFL